MPRVVQFTAPHVVDVVDCPEQELVPGSFRVRTTYSGISAGTELTAYRGSNPYLTKRWDPDRRLFGEGTGALGYPVQGWGYSEVGTVTSLAPDLAGSPVAPAVGDVVVGGWGHRSDVVLGAASHDWEPLPPGVPALHGVFTRVGAVALNAVLAADCRLGETVAVFGQGVIGLLASQLVRASGARVAAVDALPGRLDVAHRLGAHDTVTAQAGQGPGAAVRELTGGVGADSAIELSGSHRGLHEAVRSVRVGGRVVAAGFYQGDGVGLRLGEEFHHNRVQILASQIGGVPNGLEGRWDRRRLQRVFLSTLADGRVHVEPLVSQVADAAEAAACFRLLDERPEQVLQVVLRFGAEESPDEGGG